MSTLFEDVENYYERPVKAKVIERLAETDLTESEAGDVLCVALNKLPPKYIQSHVSLSFYTTSTEMAQMDKAIDQAVEHALHQVSASRAYRSD